MQLRGLGVKEGISGGVSPHIGANGLRSVMARIHANARGDAGLHHSLCHHNSCRATGLGISVPTIFQSYSYCGTVSDMAINNNVPVFRECRFQPVIQYDLYVSVLPHAGGRILSQENS